MLGMDMFSFNSLRAGGGKGGSLMQFTNDQMLLVKQLSKDDVRSLLAFAEDYCNHVIFLRLDNPPPARPPPLSPLRVCLS